MSCFHLCLLTALIGVCSPSFSQYSANHLTTLKNLATSNLEKDYDNYKSKALDIWHFAELGYQEKKSSALLMSMLQQQGFTIDSGVAGMPTAFVASYGSGLPVIGILAEYDALPGLSQEAIPERKIMIGQSAGHGCGHHLFGVASVAAGIEIKKLIASGQLKGTIKVFGCPAEEGGSGKVYLVREGFFRDVDIAIHWHPDDINAVSMNSALANISAKFTFKGLSAHASSAPDKGRSALDAVEAMNFMVNLMREHIPTEARVHYVITNGGKAPNVVPDLAEVYYYVRHPKRDELQNIFNRVVDAAEGAAKGTGTSITYEVQGGTYDLLINHTLAKAMHQNLLMAGGVKYTAADVAFAEGIRSSFTFDLPALYAAQNIDSLRVRNEGMGSTDVGDVSWVVPTVGLRAATWVPGTPAHSWQAVACGGTEIGTKGMMVAAKSMAMMAIDLYTQPNLIKDAKKEWIDQTGDKFIYTPLLGNRPPALNYRD